VSVGTDILDKVHAYEYSILIDLDYRGEANVRAVTIFVDEDRFLCLTADPRVTGPKIHRLIIGGRQVPYDAFYRIPGEPVGGPVLGWVNLPWNEGDETMTGAVEHVVWLNEDGDVRRGLLPDEPPPGADPAEWAERHRERSESPQLYIG
jgi:hypothetical protein